MHGRRSRSPYFSTASQGRKHCHPTHHDSGVAPRDRNSQLTDRNGGCRKMSTRRALARTDTAARDRRDCEHPGTPHRHGTRVAYVTDQCRCACRAANRADERIRTAALRAGAWRPLVDAGPSRAHLQRLRQHGVGLDQIVRISQAPKRTIRRVLEKPAFRLIESGRKQQTACWPFRLPRRPGAAEPGGRHTDPRPHPHIARSATPFPTWPAQWERAPSACAAR